LSIDKKALLDCIRSLEKIQGSIAQILDPEELEKQIRQTTLKSIPQILGTDFADFSFVDGADFLIEILEMAIFWASRDMLGQSVLNPEIKVGQEELKPSTLQVQDAYSKMSTTLRARSPCGTGSTKSEISPGKTLKVTRENLEPLRETLREVVLYLIKSKTNVKDLKNVPSLPIAGRKTVERNFKAERTALHSQLEDQKDLLKANAKLLDLSRKTTRTRKRSGRVSVNRRRPKKLRNSFT
jgi:hypothetical protein